MCGALLERERGGVHQHLQNTKDSLKTSIKTMSDHLIQTCQCIRSCIQSKVIEAEDGYTE